MKEPGFPPPEKDSKKEEIDYKLAARHLAGIIGSEPRVPELERPQKVQSDDSTRREHLNKLRVLIEGATERYETAKQEGLLRIEGLKKYLSERSKDVGTKIEEWSEKLSGFSGSAKEHLKMGERTERLKAYLAERSNGLQEKAKEYGPKVAGFIGATSERYNKLDWRTKLTITSALVVGVSLTSITLPTLSGILSVALYGQRALGGIGFAMNQRKKLDAKIAAKEDYWLAGKSERVKNTYATILTAVYMGGTALVVHEGVEVLNTLKVNEWLGNILGPDAPPIDTGLTKPRIPDTSPAPAPAETPTPEMSTPDTSAVELAEARVATDRAFADVKQTLDEAQKLASEQQVTIDKAVTDYGNDISPVENETVSSEAKGLEELKAEVNADLNAHQELNDALNKIEADRFRAKLENPDFKADEALRAEIVQENLQQNVPKNTGEITGQQNIEGDTSGAEKIDEGPEAQGAGKVSPEAPFGRDANGHSFASEQEAKDYDDLIKKGIRDPREIGAWPPGPPQEKGLFEEFSDWLKEKLNTTDSISPPAPESITAPPTTVTSESEFPVGSIRGEDIIVNNSGLAISIDNPHIYTDPGVKHLFIHGGSFADQGSLIQKYLAEHPKSIIYGTDSDGKYRIPWHLVGGEMTPGAPVQTSGFFGFFKSFMKAPEPDEFKALIK